jgi:hypothetical protein
MNAFAMEGCVLRAERLRAAGKGELAALYTAVFCRSAMETVESAARGVLAAASAGDGLRTNLAILRRLARFEPVNAVEIRRTIAGRLLDANRYVV